MIVGNGRMLAVIDSAEVKKLFWPDVNSYQNMVSSQIGVFNIDDNKLDWLDNSWSYSAEYVKRTNILKTEATKGKTKLTIFDFVIPTEDVLVRRIECDQPQFVYYFTKTQLAEQHGNSVSYSGFFLHNSKDVWMSVSSDAVPKEFSVDGKKADDGIIFSPNIGMENPKAIAQASQSKSGTSTWSFFTKNEKGKNVVTMYLCLSQSKRKLFNLMNSLSADSAKLLDKTKYFWNRWLDKTRLKHHDNGAEERSLLSLKLLQAPDGGFVSSVRDRSFSFRDGAYAGYAFDIAGLREESERFYAWAKSRTLDAQPDALSSLIFWIYNHYTITKDRAFLSKSWDSVRKIMAQIEKQTSVKAGIVMPALWEEKLEIGYHSIAGIYAAFDLGSKIAGALGDDHYERVWREAAEKVRDSRKSCSHETFHASYRDRGVEASLLSLAIPFGMVEPWDEKMRKTVEKIEKELWSDGLKKDGKSEKSSGYTSWLAWYYKKTGNMKKHRHALSWVERNIADENASGDYSAWSHAMHLIASLE